LEEGGKDWCIYHDGLPQAAGITSLRDEFIIPFTEKFQDMDDFFDDVKKRNLADYNFIEPRYDTGNNYLDGNSMHPLNDIRKGERLVKRVYEALRNSPYWRDTMLIITFDEHGGFYDHQPPPATIPPGDNPKYANANYHFRFDRLGVRVPAIVVSAYTGRGTIIGDDPGNAGTVFDHSSVLATVEERFGLEPLTKRDRAANTLDVAINLTAPRLLPKEAPTKLPKPASAGVVAGAANPADIFAADAKVPLSANQKTMAALALACELEITPPNYHAALISNHQKIVERKDAADYIQKVEGKIVSRHKGRPAGN
jgi:phospholipase C